MRMNLQWFSRSSSLTGSKFRRPAKLFREEMIIGERLRMKDVLEKSQNSI
jgi:hypothetical protein